MGMSKLRLLPSSLSRIEAGIPTAPPSSSSAQLRQAIQDQGAIKNIIGGRFDQGGMRWTKERAEALLQLRCLEVNGDWESFIDWVHDDMRDAGNAHGHRIRLQQNAPASLPKLAEAA